MFDAEYSTYQDVRKHIRAWSMILLPGMWAAFFFLVLPPEVRLSTITYLKDTASAFSAIGVAILSLGLFSAIGYLLIETFQAHELYDRIFIRWRKQFDLNFLLIRLVAPFRNCLDARFDDFCRQNRDTFMTDLFYYFVRDQEPRIARATITRFYEAVTRYWQFQFTELCMVLWLIALYFSLYWSRSPQWRAHLLLVVGGWLILWFVVRLVSAYFRRIVSARTFDEIAEIHNYQAAALEDRLRLICHKYSLSYVPR